MTKRSPARLAILVAILVVPTGLGQIDPGIVRVELEQDRDPLQARMREPVMVLHGWQMDGNAADYDDWRDAFQAWVRWGWTQSSIYTWEYYACDRGPTGNATGFASLDAHDYPSFLDEPARHDRVARHADNHDGRCGIDLRAEDPFENAYEGHSEQTFIQHLAYHWAWGVHEEFTAKGQCVHVVAHSMGGLIVRYALGRVEGNMRGTPDSEFPPSLCVRTVVTLGTPHQGTHLGNLCQEERQCLQMRPGSDFLDDLNSHYPAPVVDGATRWTAIGSDDDRVVHELRAVGEHGFDAEDEIPLWAEPTAERELPFRQKLWYWLRNDVTHSAIEEQDAYYSYTQKERSATIWYERNDEARNEISGYYPMRWAFLEMREGSDWFVPETSRHLHIEIDPLTKDLAPGDTFEIRARVSNTAVWFDANVKAAALMYAPDGTTYRPTMRTTVDPDLEEKTGIEMSPSREADIDAQQTQRFMIEGTVPEGDVIGLHSIAINMRDERFYATEKNYEDDFYVEPAFFVGEPKVVIVSPKPGYPVYAGPASDPRSDVEARVRIEDALGRPVPGLVHDNFRLFVDGEPASFVVEPYDAARQSYRIHFAPPAVADVGVDGASTKLADLRVALRMGLREAAFETRSDGVKYGLLTEMALDTVLVIDRSGSMLDEGKMDAARRAAQAFVDRLHGGDGLAVVSFADGARLDAPLRELGPVTREEVADAIEGLVADGGTNIQAGLEAGVAEWTANSTEGGALNVVLMTDGEDHSTVAGLLAAVPEDARVFTIGLGTAVQAAKLSALASGARGTYAFSPGEAQLDAIYATMAGRLRGEAGITSAESRIDPGALQTHVVPVAAGARQASFTATVAGSELGLALVAPDGQRFDENVTDTRVTFTEHGLTKTFQVADPAPGEWRLEVAGLDVSPDEAYRVATTSRGGPTVVLAPDRDAYGVGEPARVRLGIVEGPVALDDVSVHAKLIGPDGRQRPVTLVDDGLHADGAAGDGLHGAEFVPTQAGSYTLVASLEGTLEDGSPFMRESETSFGVGGAPPAGDLQVRTWPASLYLDEGAQGKVAATLSSTKAQVGTLSVTDLVSPAGTIPASALNLSRTAFRADAGVAIEVSAGIAVPLETSPGRYSGAIVVAGSTTAAIPIEVHVSSLGLDVMPVSLIVELPAAGSGRASARVASARLLQLDQASVIVDGVPAEWANVTITRDRDGAWRLDLTVSVPEDAPVGEHVGTVHVVAGDRGLFAVPMAIRVTEAIDSSSALLLWLAGGGALLVAAATVGWIAVGRARRSSSHRLVIHAPPPPPPRVPMQAPPPPPPPRPPR